jgi:transcriptional regulator with XRE-family HTH domain
VRKRSTPTTHAHHLTLRFGTIVRHLRQRLGISQEELAWRADIHRTYLADIERGGRNVSLTNIVRIVGALDTSLAEFFFMLEEYFQSPVEPAPPKAGLKPLRAPRSSKRKIPVLRPAAAKRLRPK